MRRARLLLAAPLAAPLLSGRPAARSTSASIPGGSRTITWPMRAVNSGTFGVYVAVLPQSGVSHPPVTGPIVRVSVATRQTLNSGGILPLALGIPTLLGLLTLVVRSRPRWRRRADTSRGP